MILQVLNHFQRRKRDISFNTPLVTALYRDGYLYFSLIMTLRLFCVCIVSNSSSLLVNLVHILPVCLWTSICMVHVKPDGLSPVRSSILQTLMS